MKNIFKKEPEPVPVHKPVENKKKTLAQLEQEHLVAAQADLVAKQNAVRAQHEAVAHIRENIAMLQDHPWFDALYDELRNRESALSGTFTTQQLVDKLKGGQ